MSMKLGVFGVLLFAIACVDEGPPEKTGELGRGGFTYLCLDTTDDAACLASQKTTFPHAIAVGAKFGMEFYKTSTSSPLEVIGGSPAHIETDYEGMTALVGGTLAVFATSSDKVLDLIHVDVVPIAELELGDWSSSNTGWKKLSRVSLDAGERRTVRSVPSDSNGRILAGGPAYEWHIDDPEVAVIREDVDGAVTTIEGVGAGRTTLTVAVGTISRSYAVEVSGSGGATDSETAFETESETASETESETTFETESETASETASDADTDGEDTDEDAGAIEDTGLDGGDV
jgi:hypothetical protein